MKIYLILPVYNESQSRLNSIISEIKKHFPLRNIVVIDDGSRRRIKPIDGVNHLRHELNLGKGAAIKTGCRFAFKKKADAIIMMDSDGQHDPNELPRFVKKLNNGYHIVFGSRRPTLDAPLVRMLGNKFASIYMNILFGIYISDILSGYRAFTRKAYRKIKWNSPRYGVETEIVARLGKSKRKPTFCEIPIETIYFDKYKGVTILDAINIMIHTLWWKLF